jgi:hypothetical protein
MAKLAATDYVVKVNGTNLSDHADSVDSPEEKEQIDVSGFGGTREFVAGINDQTIEVEFLQDYAAGSVHSILGPIFDSGTTCTIYVWPSSTGSGTTNPSWGGTANIFSYNRISGALNDVAKITATFKPASGAVFAEGTTAP